MSEEVSIS